MRRKKRKRSTGSWIIALTIYIYIYNLMLVPKKRACLQKMSANVIATQGDIGRSLKPLSEREIFLPLTLHCQHWCLNVLYSLCWCCLRPSSQDMSNGNKPISNQASILYICTVDLPAPVSLLLNLTKVVFVNLEAMCVGVVNWRICVSPISHNYKLVGKAMGHQ